MAFDIISLIIFISGIAYYAGTLVPKLDTLAKGQIGLKAYLEKELTEMWDTIQKIEKRVEEHDLILKGKDDGR